MATLREQKAGYVQRDHVRRVDKYLGDALDDIASQVGAVLRQGNFSTHGTPEPPSRPAALSVIASNGLVTATIQHPSAPKGTQWILYYSTSPTFSNPVKITLLHPIWQQYLPQQTLYFRATAQFPASNETDPVYFGNSISPTSVATGISQS